MNLSQFLSILRARWSVALLIFVLTVGTAVGMSLLMKKQYTATATVVVDQTRPDPISSATYSGNPSPAFMATQVDVLNSDRIAQQVVRKLGMLDDEGWRADWMKATGGEGSFEAWVVAAVKLRLEVRPSRESNVISVGYKSSDPLRAAKLANAFVQAYLDVSVELRVDPAKQYSTFFDARSKELRENIERAQAKLSAYQREKGVVIASDGQLDVENARLNELSSQLAALQAVAAETSSRQAQVQLGAGDRLQEVVGNPVLAGLRGDITRAEARLQELNSRLGENHPQVIEAKATIATLRARLETETRRITGTYGVSNSINRHREVELRAAVEAQRARVLKMRTAREEGSVLLRDVENAQRAYDAVLNRLQQSSLESRTTQSNAYMLAQASPPLVPSSPKVLRNVVLAIVVGLVLAIGAALVLEFVDRRVRTEEEVSELIGLPLLGVLPRPGGKGRFRRTPLPLVSAAGLRRLTAPSHREA
ncbi:MAG: chain length determinant protein EpsF [Ideonella sp.]|nr:chain length determinant protein EpsF [Ideonella sp.]MCC7459358.1 chain length determinant protein EpsF [Nitrospira sp.]